MESNKLLQADLLDILFEGRNKEYGAYELRKTYNRRLYKSLLVTGSVIGLLFIGSYVSGRGSKARLVYVIKDSIQLVDPPTSVPLPPPPPPPKAPQPQVAMKIFTNPLLVKTDPPEDIKPPEQTDLDHVKIGTVNTTGTADVGVETAPPIGSGGPGVVEAPKAKEEDASGFIPIEKESEYPGGAQAWLRYLNKTFHYPDEAVNINAQGVVVVQFIVDGEGTVSDVQAISGPEQGGLREEAVRVIKKSGKWTPALQNGRFVKSYKRQPIVFKVME